MAFCTKCGTQLADDAAFCPNCGQAQNNKQTDSAAPVFTPPTPTFTPPAAAKPSYGGVTCYYHTSEPAVAQCARCGKYICKDCFDNYGVSGGDYAGQALCYDCCQQLVAENVAELTKNKKKIKFQFILSIVGIAIGFILGFAAGIGEGFGTALIGGLLYGCIGGVFLSAIKAYFSMLWEAIKTGLESGWVAAVIGLLIGCIVIAFKCIWATISNTVQYISYLKKTSGFIESDTAALQQMKDYMEYTMIRNQNRGVDLETLLNEKSELADNSYARMVRDQGEEGAEATLRGCVASINENGEIIRSLAA